MSVLLYIIGSLAILIGGVEFLDSTTKYGGNVVETATGIAVIISGVLFLAFGNVVGHLKEIADYCKWKREQSEKASSTQAATGTAA